MSTGEKHEKRLAAIEGLKFLRVDEHDHHASVYEVKRITLKNGAFVTERRVSIESISERVVWVSNWVEKERLECFCCTCEDHEWGNTMDAACRNHGYYGKRPCDIHNLPGYTWEDSNEMPESVLTIRKKQAETSA
jgi:hypothetical protein